MALPDTVMTSQEALDAILSDTLPRQGCWSDEEYLWLTDRTRRLIEFTDGCIEELPLPTSSHQAILAFLYRAFYAHLAPRGGAVMFSALRLRIREGKFREPDILVLRDRTDPRYQDRFWLGADVVVEVVSPDRPERGPRRQADRLRRGGNPGVLDRRSPARHHHRADALGGAPTSSTASTRARLRRHLHCWTALAIDVTATFRRPVAPGKRAGRNPGAAVMRRPPEVRRVARPFSAAASM